MFRKIKHLSLEKQLLISFLSVSVLLLVLSLSISLYYNITRQRNEIDKNISNVASYIASMDRVLEMLKAGYPSQTAVKELDSLYENFPDLNVIDIYNQDGLRFYHTTRQETGETFAGGDEIPILSGSAPYITTGYGTHGTQRRAFHAIKNEGGTIIGFVMTSVFTNYIYDQVRRLLLPYFMILAVMFLVSVILSQAIVRILRASLMGHHPSELLDLYIKQDKVLNAIEEGIIASDKTGTVIFANQTALSVFSGEPQVTGRQFKDLFPASDIVSVLETGTAVYHKPCTLNDHRLLVNEIPIGNGSPVQGVLTILNDRTELESISDELTGAHSMLDTLRAFNHEFLNKLHVILGYLQTGQTQEAITFIINSNLVSSQSIRQTADCLRVPKICALVIGKMMHAAELGILLSVTPDSRCYERELLLPVENYITIIGNLLENAIEELSAGDKSLREITLGIHCSEGCTIITCEDTGNGIRPDLIDHIYEKGISSKGENRGTGLFLIRQLVEEYHGEIAIDTEPQEGTCFTLTFTGPSHS